MNLHSRGFNVIEVFQSISLFCFIIIYKKEDTTFSVSNQKYLIAVIFGSLAVLDPNI